MGFKLLVMNPADQEGMEYVDAWPDKLREMIPDIEVSLVQSVGEAMEVIGEVDAAFGNIVPGLFQRANNLKWIACPQAGPKAGYYHQALLSSDVTVTNTREIYNDHISAQIMSYVLTFARGLHVYIPRQLQREWSPGYETIHLPDSTAVVVGIGGIGAETARLCSEFGMTVIGVDPRVAESTPGISEVHRPEALDNVLPRGDFVIVTVPETPETQGMFGKEQFRRMKSDAFFINIGRGATVVLDDLVEALREGQLAGAGLDVFQIEPLPSDHPLWSMPGVLITPHVAGRGPYLEDRRTELFLENCQRFNEGRPLRNVVDKAQWF
jgi:phosphoglycerate dehydrogenase-like enzyme